MQTKISGFIGMFGLSLFLFMHSLGADSAVKQVQSGNQTEEYVEEEDIWYGPGFYYGTWFDNEQDYWGWRDNHPDYPSNRNYYNHDHPVEYHPEEHRDDGEERDRSREGEGRVRGGGGHRGGGRR